MNRAKTLIEPVRTTEKAPEVPTVSADTPVVDLLGRLVDSPSHTLSVTEGDRQLGVLTETLLLEGLAREFSQKDDCALISVECAPADYSASRLAMAVEDAGYHLLDLWSSNSEDGRVSVSLRIRCNDPSPAVHALERYGYEVTDVHANNYADAETASERLLALQRYLSV